MPIGSFSSLSQGLALTSLRARLTCCDSGPMFMPGTIRCLKNERARNGFVTCILLGIRIGRTQRQAKSVASLVPLFTACFRLLIPHFSRVSRAKSPLLFEQPLVCTGLDGSFR